MSTYDEKGNYVLTVYAFIFIFLVMGIIAGGILSYRDFELGFHRQAEKQISAIAELKVNGLVNWRSERLSDARFFYQNPAFSSLVEDYFENPDDASLRAEITNSMERYQSNVQYDQISLLDAEGRNRLVIPASSNDNSLAYSDLARDAAASLSSKEIIFLDFYRITDADDRIYISILVPIFAEQSGRPLGVLLLRVDPETYLYPYINQWPIPSDTSETLLVRREGEDVLFLNELRFTPDTALNLRFPLSQTETPAVQAVLGRAGVVEGMDYRGEPVLAGVRPVPDSPWFLVSKMDSAEVYAPLRERLWQTLLIVGMAIFLAGLGLITIWRQQRVLFYRAKAKAAEALRASENKFSKTFMLSPDSININRLQDGMYVSINNGFARITGYTPEEVIGKTSLELSIWAAPQDRKKMVDGLLKNGEVENLEMRFLMKNGDIKHGLMSASVLELDGVPHIISITRDISDIKQADQKIREAQLVLESSPVVLFRWKAAEGWPVELVSENVAQFGYKPEDFLSGAVPYASIIHPDDLERVVREVREYSSSGVDRFQQEYRILTKDGQVRWTDDQTVIERDALGKIMHFQGTVTNITERKQAEEELHRQTALFRNLFERSPEALTIVDQEDRILNVNRSFETLFGYREAEIQGQYVNDLIVSEPYLDEAESITQTSLGIGQVVEKETVRCTKDGRLVDVSMVGYPIVVEGRIIGGSAIYRDITERKRAEEELRRQTAMFRNLFAGSPEAIAVLDHEDCVLEVNRSFETLFGYLDAEVRGRNINDLVASGPYLDDAQDVSQTVLGKKQIVEKESIRCAKDGHLVDVSIIGYPIVLEQQMFGAYAIYRDITERKKMEQSLHERERQYRTLVEQIPAIVYVDDVSNGVHTLYIGPQVEQILGYAPQEWLEKSPSIWDLQVHPDDLVTVNSKFMRCAENGEPFEAEYRIRTADGRLVWVHDQAVLLRDENGNPQLIHGVMQDITERRRAEEKYRHIFENAMEAITQTTPQGKYITANPSAARIIGYDSPEEMMVARIDLDRQFYVKPGRRDEFKRLMEEQGSVSEFESEVYRRDGSRIWILENSRAVCDEHGNLLYFEGTAQDITERKQAEERLEQFFSINLDLLCIADLDGNFIKVNKAWESILGYSTLELEHRKFLEFVHPDDMDSTLEAVAVLGRQEQVLKFVNRYRCLDGSYRFIEWRSQPSGNLIYAAARDITERMQAEEALRKSEEKMSSIFRVAPTGIGVVSDRVLVEVNPRISEMTGYAKEELLGQSARILYPTQEEFEWVGREKYKQITEKGTGVVETRWQTKDGSIVDVLLSSTPIDLADLSKGVTFTSLDVTDRKRAENELRESEEKYRSVVEKSHDGILLINEHGLIIEWNQSMEALTGLSQTKTIGQFAWDVLHQISASEFKTFERLEFLRNSMEQFLRTGQASWLGKTLEVTIHRPDGVVRTVLESNFPIETARGFMRGSVFRDITERKRMEDALRESEEKMRSIIRVAPVGIGAIRDQKFYEVNPRVSEITGYSVDELVGQSAQMLHVTQEEFEWVIREQLEKIARQEEAVVETRWRKKDGPVIDVLLSSTLIDPDDFSKGAIFTVLDITERRQAEKALLESRALFHSLVESLPQNVYSKDLDGHFTFANQNYCATEGRTLAEILGKTDFDLHPAELAQQYHADDRHVMETGQVIEKVEVHQPLGGERSYVQVTKALIHDAEGQVKGLLGIFWDVTDRRRDEETLRVTLAKYKTLFESFPLGISVTDEAGNILETNAVAEKLLAVPQEEHIQRDIDSPKWRIIRMDGTPMPPDEFASVQALREKHIVENAQMGILKPDDSVTWLSVTATPLPVEGYGVVVTYADITARKEAEESLRDSERMFRVAFDNAPTGMSIIGAAGFKYLAVNPLLCEMFGYTKEEFLGQTIKLVTHPDDETRSNEWIRKKYNNEPCEPDFEKRYIHKDGHIVWGLVRAQWIRNEDGSPRMAINHILDITKRKQAEDALRKSEALYHDLVETSQDLIWQCNAEGEYTYLNPAWEQVFGYKIEEMLGKKFTDFQTPQTAARDHEEFSRLLQGSTVKGLETIHIGKSGNEIQLAFNAKFLTDDNGKIIGTRGTAYDITARKQAEAALLESEERFRTYYENATIGLYRTTPDGRILMLNPAGVRMMGFDSFDEISKRDLEHAEFKALRNEFREKIERDGVVIGLESKWIKKDSSTIFVRESAKAIRDGNGKTLYYDGSFEDVTERVRAEAALRESEELYRRMNQNSPLGMHFYNLHEANQLIFAGANPAADKLLGVNNSQFIGKSIEEAFPPLAETEASRRYRDAAAKGIPWSTEQISYADGQINGAFEVRAFQTTPGNMVAVFADITARKRAEEKILNLNAELEQRVRERTLQLETTNKELEAFSYSVSHDLRAPLRGIDGWSQALFEDYHEKLDEQGKQYIERVRAETQRMGRLIDDMLRLSRLTRAEMNSQPVDLSALAQAIVERLQRDAPNRKVEVNIQPGMVAQGDLRLLESALVNLLENAFKFTGKRADARIEFGQTELEGQRVFFVRDNGAGFDMAYAQKLFGAFQRMHKSSEFPGTGVGLAIVQRIIHRHGGRVWAEAEIGRGAAFYLTLG